jgi:hypothetical protein
VEEILEALGQGEADMGEAKRKREVAKTMKESTHGNDVNVEQSPEAIATLIRNQRIEKNLRRLHNYIALVTNDRINIPHLMAEMYSQSAYDAATAAAIGEAIGEVLGIDSGKLVDRATELVEAKLHQIEKMHGIIIEPDKIIQVAKNVERQQGSDSGAAEKESGNGTSSPHN